MTHHSRRPVGLPLWLLLACLPVVLASGFVTGLAIAAYRPVQAASQPSGQGAASPSGQTPDDAATAATSTVRTDSSWRIVTLPGGGTTAAGATDAWDVGSAPANNPGPSAPAAKVPFTGPAADIREARLALQSDYSTYKAGGNTLSIEYQQMSQVARGGKSVVGLISADQYEAWAAALRSNPDALKAWLESAAKRVQEAAIRDRFHLSWAIVDVLRDPPAGFAPYEVTLLDNRTYLVVRPLASTLDHTKTEVSLRPQASLDASVAGEQITSTAPWAAYGPQIRFDATDLYRPARTTGAVPINR